MNQDDNFNHNNFNTQGNNGIPNNQPLNNQSFSQGMNINQQTTPSYGQPIMQEPVPQPMNTFENSDANNSNFNSKPPKKMNLGLIIGIVVVVAVVGVAIIFGSKLLSNDRNNNAGNNNKIENNNNSNNGIDNSQEEDSNFYETWGRTDFNTTFDGVNIDHFYINVPKYTGSNYWYAKISEQLDDTVVFISGQYETPFVEQVSDIFSSYIEYTKESLKDFYGIQSSNFNITIDSSKSLTIGDYDMYMHTGIITYDYRNSHNDTTKRTHQYVAYATKLNGSGNCAYWIVYDFSDDQSKGNLIQEHALNMAKTFREEK